MDDKIKQHNIEWYKKTYDSLIEKGKSENYNVCTEVNIYYHVHHIVPKCLGGMDEESNLVKLTIRQHIIAHMLLSCIYPDNVKLLTATYLMIGEWGTKKYMDRKIISSKLAARFEEQFLKTQIGKVIPDEFREKYGRIITEDEKQRISATLKARGRAANSTNARRVIAEGVEFDNVKDCAIRYGIAHRTMVNWMKDPLKPQFQYLTPPATKRIQGPDGTIYESIRSAAKILKRSRAAIRNWLNNYPEMGYKYI